MILSQQRGVMAADSRLLVKGAAIALLASVSPLAMAPALADTAPAPSAASTDIVVTATKRSESVQKVPIAMTALGAAALEEHHVTSFDDYAKMLPSVSYQSFGPSQSQLYFRGIATGGDGGALGPLPAVGFYIDETPVTTIYGSVDMHVYDMSRIEALSGPQGTLYGASSLSGTLRMITNPPKIGKWAGGIDAEVNKFGPGAAGGQVEGFLNIPINDSMAARIVGFWQHDGGYIDNTPGCRVYQRLATMPHQGTTVNAYYDQNNAVQILPGADPNANSLNVCNSPKGVPLMPGKPTLIDNTAGNNQNDVTTVGGRAALKIDLDSNWTATPTVLYQHQIAHGTFLYGPEVNGADDLQVHDFTPERNRDEWYLAALTLQGKLGNWDVTYAGSYFEREVDTVADYSYFTVAYDQTYADYTDFATANGTPLDPTQILHTHDHYTKTSHELRISSPSDSRLRVTAGLFLQRQTDARVADYLISGGLSNDPNAPVPPVDAAHPEDVYYTGVDRIDRDYAAFAEGYYDITDKVTLTAGIRGFRSDNTLTGFSGSNGSLNEVASLTPCAVVTIAACPNVNKRYAENGETHKVSLKWQIDPSAMVYFTYSTGFRPGGNNRTAYFYANGTLKSQDPGPFKADRLTNYELGWKTSLFNRKLRLNGALFWEDWSDVQYGLPGIQGIFYTVNAGTARSKGIELEVAYKPVPSWTFSANGTYADAKLTSDFCDQVNGCAAAGGTTYAPAGTRLPVTPQVKINGTARYEVKIGDYNTYVQGSVNYQSDITTNLRTDWEAITGIEKGFATADFSAGVSKDSWTFDAFITNAFDKRGIVGINQACSASGCLTDAKLLPTRPQQFGLKAGYRF